MLRLQHERASDRTDDGDGRPRLRAVGLVCDRCGHEQALDDARLAGWHVARDGQRVVCASCIEADALDLDDLVLYFPACGHPVEHDGALYSRPVCLVCDP
jgi:hypothetical protein